MFWIEGIARTESGFALEAVYTDGARTHRPLADLALATKTAGTKRTRVTTDCATWGRGTAAPFWDWLGIEKHKPNSRHAVFEVEADGKQYLIPAATLIAALARPIQHIHAFLFRPQGLESFSTPLLGSDRPGVGLHLPEYRVFGARQRTSEGLLACYSWMHCFPSARAMWDSVYAFANAGYLDLFLPLASLTMTLHSVPWRGKHLVVELVVMSATANDAPFAFAEGHPKHLAFHDSAAVDWKVAHKPANTIPPRGAEWPLSDDEWASLTAKLKPRSGARFDLRRIVDFILIKFGTGVAWRKLDYEELNLPIVQATYQRMQKDGRWAEVEELLLAARAAH
ncbi:Putative transposase of IS4/5 family [Aromatoleum tolulyticum]|uniref:Putative transposase of IS4/5 family n=1 Tax=Aromatoleum tolulyticum TaxID=34027 RepID=A0A1N6N7B0_9RHOO|nr:transposase [Aromatoleum tolulyticum]SIP87949.1 Putative transposase of IS4/5 family [Aromatoleum tolulyticum]